MTSEQPAAAPDTADARTSSRGAQPLRAEFLLFAVLGVFFLIVATIYLSVSEAEVVGSTGFYLLAGMSFIIAGYLWVVKQRIPLRPEDDPHGEISQRTGEVGVFAPYSWWPLVLGAAAALVFLGAAIGWWISGIGAVIGLIGLVGHTFEFSRGPHAH